MKFQVSTKPLVDALSLGVVKQNVTAYYQKSCLAQVTASRRELKINLEAVNVLTELVLKGSGDSDDVVTMFVDCVLLRDLVNTFEANVTTIEFVEGGLVLHSGKSKFTISQMLDSSEIELTAPAKVSESESSLIDIDKSDWKFIRDHQMHAIAMSFIHPVYTYVWVGDNGDVLVGDVDNSIFTHSSKSKLGTTCLLSSTIINIFNSLPDGAKIRKDEKSYVIYVSNDAFEYVCEFRPEYESDPKNGSYNSGIILSMMTRDNTSAVKVSTAVINKFLSQAMLLNKNSEALIQLTVKDGALKLVNENVDCNIPVENAIVDYSISFKTQSLVPFISNFDEENVWFAPMVQDDIVAGVVVWSNNMTAVLASIDE